MIHLVSFMDIGTGLGRTIYHDNSLQISQELIWPMICALNTFVKECTSSEKGLVNASLEEIKIYLYSPLGETNPLRFVFFTDIYENNEYLEMRGQKIFEILSSYISYEKFDPPSEVMEKVQKIAQYTQIFPAEKLEKVFLDQLKQKLRNLEEEDKMFVVDLFIGDIDQGKVYAISSRDELREKNSVALFSELLTAFSIDSEIFVKSALSENENRRLERNKINSFELQEGWYLKQLAKRESDFWLVGYFYYKALYEEEVIALLNWIHLEISDRIIDLLEERPF